MQRIAAINKLGGFGRWAILDIADPSVAKNGIRSFIAERKRL